MSHGLSKRCPHPRRQWTKCGCSWHFEFFCRKTASVYGRAKHRYSLTSVAESRHLPPPSTKHEAEALADVVRSELRAGTFRPPRAPEPVAVTDPSALTVGDVIDQYLVRHGACRGGGRRAYTRCSGTWPPCGPRSSPVHTARTCRLATSRSAPS